MNNEDLITILRNEKESALEYRRRRHADWKTNYTLSRDKVITNRLTQRQTVNIPLMKYGLGTILKDVNQMPTLYFSHTGNDKQREIFFNEYWKEVGTLNDDVLRDRVNKKQGMLFGRSFRKLNIVDGVFKQQIIDPQSILIDRYVDPIDIDTARMVAHVEIFKTLDEIVNNKEYDKNATRELAAHYEQENTTIELDENYARAESKRERLSDMGVTDMFSPVTGAKYIELNEIYRKEYDEDLDLEVIQLYTVAMMGDGMTILLKKPLYEVIGDNDEHYWYSHYPFTSLSVELDLTDFWNDSPADTLRQPNLVLNSWMSQLVENRTLRNFNMHYMMQLMRVSSHRHSALSHGDGMRCRVTLMN